MPDPIETLDLVALAGSYHPRFRRIDIGPATVMIARLATTGGDPLAEWVVDGTVWFVERLGELARADDGETTRRSAVVIWPAPRLTTEGHEAADAFIEALRACVHAATLEEAFARVRLSVVVCTDASVDDAQTLLAHVLSDHGDFVAGGTFDLRDPSWRASC